MDKTVKFNRSINWVAVAAAMVIGSSLPFPADAQRRDLGVNQPGAVGNRGGRDLGVNQPGVIGNAGYAGSARQVRAISDPGLNQPGAVGNRGRDPGFNQPGAAGNRRL